MNDALLELIDDAIEDTLLAHAALDNDSRCSCGARNNMDGDVLHGHRLGAVSEAVRAVLSANLIEEQRTLTDGEGGMTTDYKTGETTVHGKPCTRQSRWATPWLNTSPLTSDKRWIGVFGGV
jgi:hypothetical protein